MFICPHGVRWRPLRRLKLAVSCCENQGGRPQRRSRTNQDIASLSFLVNLPFYHAGDGLGLGGQIINGISADDAVLWLWTTNGHLPNSCGIVEHWGFRYVTMLTWTKHKMGMGDWLRGKTEHCLMCVKGKPAVTLTNQTTSLLANAGAHSQKSNQFYALVEQLCPGSKVEMFQRRTRPGWVGHEDESR